MIDFYCCCDECSGSVMPDYLVKKQDNISNYINFNYLFIFCVLSVRICHAH